MSLPPQRARARRSELVTLAVTVALAVALGGIVWLSVTSIPYLAVSPSTDPTFGALNACLLPAVPERVGFAVSRDGLQAAAWSTNTLVVCEGTPPIATKYERSGVTLGAFDFTGALWIGQDARDVGGGGLWRLERGAFVERGALTPAALVGTAEGVVALDAQGQLVSLAVDGAVSATRPLPFQRNVHVLADASGTLIALFGGGKFAVVNAKTLDSTSAEAPCAVTWAWWRPDSPLVLVQCVDLVFEVNAIDSRSNLLDPRQRIRSTLMGTGNVYVQPCDSLPCSATPPP